MSLNNKTCVICGREITEDWSNPAVHYSGGSNICVHCEIRKNAKTGDWLQDKNGNYYQKYNKD